MAKKLWDGVDEPDFSLEDNIQDEDIADYDLEKMKLFSANINYFRQGFMTDSLKPVERRILFTLYDIKAVGNAKYKCSKIVGDVLKIHGHGDDSVYQAMVNAAQKWKKQAPLIQGHGNFGNASNPDGFADRRYTEATMSRYAYECFFEDYDKECVPSIHNTSVDGDEPLVLPSKFPNILVNGGMGIAVGNAFCIPPYPIPEVVKWTKKLLEHPETTDVYMTPMSPTGCMIVDKDNSLRKIANTGNGTFRMRGEILIEESNNGRYWILKVISVPWLVSLVNVDEKLVQLAKDGVLPIKDIQNRSYQILGDNGEVNMNIDYRIFIDKANDPYQIRDKIYKSTELEKTIATNFKVVLSDFTIQQMSLKDLIMAWIDERREYKRRLLNKRIVKISTRIEILKILIYLLKEDNIEKTIKIIKDSDSSEAVAKLAKFGNMNSFQAKEIYNMRLSAFTKDARARYKEELVTQEKNLDECMEIVKDRKKIDGVILKELDDLQKYDRKIVCKIVSDDTENRIIPDTNHSIITTHQGYIKKLTVDKGNRAINFGVFKKGDYPTNHVYVNNLDSITVIDTYGKFTEMPVYDIEATDPNNYGTRLRDVFKLEGEVVDMFSSLPKDLEDEIKNTLSTELVFVSLTKNGAFRKTTLEEIRSIKGNKNTRCIPVKKGDSLVYAGYLTDDSMVCIYTKSGTCAILKLSEIAPTMKTAYGVNQFTLEEDDECVGISTLNEEDDCMLVVTEKGAMKKVELQFLQLQGKKRTSILNITTLEAGDNVFYVGGIGKRSKVNIITKNGIQEYVAEDISTLAKKSKPVKKIPLGLGSVIISVEVTN